MGRRNKMSPYLRRALVFAALLAFCGALIALRVARTSSTMYMFLVWNLFLAAIPAVASFVFAWSSARGQRAVAAVAFIVWLLFLPNAPYILTDFIHLTPQPGVPLWFDVAILAASAGTGLLLGYTSLADVQHVIARHYGRPAGWSVAAASLLLSGFGIYVGRFLRWNSWDALTNPHRLVRDIVTRAADPLAHPRTIGMTLIYGTGLLLGYIALRVIGATTERRGAPRTA
jgi:uncharacterized membrane protein